MIQNLNESIELAEARSDAFRDLKAVLSAQGGRLLKHGPHGVRVANRAWAGLRQAIEKAGGRFSLKKSADNREVGQVNFGGHQFNVVHEPDAYPGEGDLISFSDGAL